MHSSSNQRTRFAGRKTDIGGLPTRRFQARAAGVVAALTMLLALGGIARSGELRPTLAVDQSATTTPNSQNADVLQDLIDAINGILGSGSGTGSGSGSGGGAKP